MRVALIVLPCSTSTLAGDGLDERAVAL